MPKSAGGCRRVPEGAEECLRVPKVKYGAEERRRVTEGDVGMEVTESAGR